MAVKGLPNFSPTFGGWLSDYQADCRQFVIGCGPVSYKGSSAIRDITGLGLPLLLAEYGGYVQLC